MGGNTTAKIKLVKVYGAACMLTGDTKVKLTYHHLHKRCNGGGQSVRNGAALCPEIHAWLHEKLELQGYEAYVLLNIVLQDYKDAIKSDDIEYLKAYRELLVPLMQEVVKERRIEQCQKLKRKSAKSGSKVQSSGSVRSLQYQHS